MAMFYACFSALHTLSARRAAMPDRRRDAPGMYRLATLALPTWFAEPVLVGLLTDREPDSDADEDWLAWGAREAFFNPFSMIVGASDAAAMAAGPVSGHGGGCGPNAAPDALDAAMRFSAQAGRAVRNVGDAHPPAPREEKPAGQRAGFVNAQDMRALETFRDWLNSATPELELGNLIRQKRQRALVYEREAYAVS